VHANRIAWSGHSEVSFLRCHANRQYEKIQDGWLDRIMKDFLLALHSSRIDVCIGHTTTC